MKKQIILDTDILNEMDDQFAIPYLISYVKSHEEFELAAITIAPFNPTRYLKIDDYKCAMQQAKAEVEKIFKMTSFSCPIFIGSDKYMSQTENCFSEATENIVRIVQNASSKVSLIGIGCATNIGMALKMAPNIASNIDITWLGGNGLGFVDNAEFNLFQDPLAVNEMLDSKASVTIVPARPVTSALVLSKEVSEKFVKPLGDLGEYLHSLIVSFSKDRCGAGRKLWDIGCIYEVFNRQEAQEKQKIDSFRASMNYLQKNGVSVGKDLNYEFDATGKPTNILCYIDSEIVLDDMIKKLVYLNEKN